MAQEQFLAPISFPSFYTFNGIVSLLGIFHDDAMRWFVVSKGRERDIEKKKDSKRVSIEK